MLKEIFSDEKMTISEVSLDELYKNISSYDDQLISDIIHQALCTMNIEHCGFQFEINVTVEQENET